MNKNARQETIRRILGTRPVSSQEELLQLLGGDVSQATLSRDLNAIGVARTVNGYIIPGVTPIGPQTAHDRNARIDESIDEYAISCETTGNLLVIKTESANAQPLARTFDTVGIGDAIGTVAGDDTILVIFRHPSSANAFARHVKSILGLRPRRSA